MKGIISYAQSFEDVILWRALGHVPNGFYIDIGAQHPVHDSVSKGFYMRGWRGLHVEPVPFYATLLQEDRPDETVLQAAVSSSGGVMNFFEVRETGLSTGDAGIAAKHRADGREVAEVSVPKVTLDDIFAQVGARDIHWLKIDVEGMESEVLEGWKSKAARPWIVVVESTYPNTQTQTHAEWEHSLQSHGYQFAYFDGLNRFYVAPRHAGLAQVLNCPPNVHDGFLMARARNDFAAQEQWQALETEVSMLRHAKVEGENRISALEAEISEQQKSSLRYVQITQDTLQRAANRERELQAELATLREAQARTEQPVQPAKTVRELLAHDGESFVRCCYMTMLGREGEPEGLANYVMLMQRGTAKLSIARQMRYSPEGRAHGCNMPRLRMALLRQKWEEVPFFGSMLSLVWPVDGIDRKLGRLESKLGVLQAWLDREIKPDTMKNTGRKRRGRQFLVDVSGIIHHDAGTGIQRVTRSILDALLASPPGDFEVVPVYTHSGAAGYFYAGCEASSETGKWQMETSSDTLEVGDGDVFLGLDYHRETTIRELPYFRFLQSRGIPVYFVVHDLLPILQPRFFMPGEDVIHASWIEALSQLDGVVCVSKTVADDMEAWMTAHAKDRKSAFKIGWSHSGADFTNARPSTGMPEEAEEFFARLGAAPSFLMVGTIEPRKGHAQALAAFERLWREGVEANLVIVGRTGWMVEELVARLRSHPERGVRLFWLEGISDACLEKVYESAVCLLAPSEGEGFGLPLIEAAQHGLPLLVRDMPIFREVAGDYACYFSGKDDKCLAQAVADWLAQYQQGSHLRSSDMPFKTWRQSADRLLEVTLGGDWYREWAPKRGVNDDEPKEVREKTGT